MHQEIDATSDSTYNTEIVGVVELHLLLDRFRIEAISAKAASNFRYISSKLIGFPRDG
jgi:hypothetical protein